MLSPGPEIEDGQRQRRELQRSKRPAFAARGRAVVDDAERVGTGRARGRGRMPLCAIVAVRITVNQPHPIVGDDALI